MATTRANYTLDIAGAFSVSRDGLELGGPPTRLAGVLLLCLASRGDHWSGRDELAQRLYPEQDANKASAAMRQTLSRLKSWLGSESLQVEPGRIRLTQNLWAINFLGPGGSRLPGSLIAPGLSHPWVDELRTRWTQADLRQSPVNNVPFTEAVRQAAMLDVGAARSLFQGGEVFFDSLAAPDFSELVALTRPRDSSEPLAEEHLYTEAVLCLRFPAMTQSLKLLAKAYRLAKKKGNAKVMLRAQSMYLFCLIEAGAMVDAAECLGHLEGIAERQDLTLLQMNAKAAYYWNTNQFEPALRIMLSQVDHADRYDRLQQLHFWTNLAVLAAEAGDIGLSEQAEAQARSVLLSGFDLVSEQMLTLGAGTRMIGLKRPWEAIEILEKLEKSTIESNRPYAELYVREAKSEALALAGEKGKARASWASAIAIRRASDLHLTPRLRARGQRIAKLI